MPRGGDRGGRRPALPAGKKRRTVSFSLAPSEIELAKKMGGSRAISTALELLATMSAIAEKRGIAIAQLIDLLDK